MITEVIPFTNELPTHEQSGLERPTMEVQGDKAPGSDGFSAECFQKCGIVLKDDLFQMFLEFSSNGSICVGMNSKFHALTLKG